MGKSSIRVQRQIGGILQEARREAGLTQTQVADRLKLPQSFVSKVESGERRIDVAQFVAFTRAIGERPDATLLKIMKIL